MLVAAGKMCKISDFGLTRDVHEGDAYHKINKGPGKIAQQYFGTIYRVQFMVLSLFLNYLLHISLLKIYYLLYIHGIYIYIYIYIYVCVCVHRYVGQ